MIDISIFFMIVFNMLSFLKRWRKKRELKKLQEAFINWKQAHEELMKKADAVEQYANTRLKELEIKLNQIEQQFELFEKIIAALDPKKRIN